MYMLVSFQHHLKPLVHQEEEISGFVWLLWELNFEGKIGAFSHVCIGKIFPFQSSELFLSTYYVQSSNVRDSMKN